MTLDSLQCLFEVMILCGIGDNILWYQRSIKNDKVTMPIALKFGYRVAPPSEVHNEHIAVPGE